LGLAASDSVTIVSRRVTRPAESWTVTCTGGLIGWPARALPSDDEKATRAGAASDGGPLPPPPFNSLSRRQLTTSAASATGQRVLIAAPRRCKGRTRPPAWNPPPHR